MYACLQRTDIVSVFFDDLGILLHYTGKSVVIVDDLVQTGGTLYESALAAKAAGATSVHAFAAHAVFPQDCWRKFVAGGAMAVFEKFWVTNSIPSVTDKLPKDSCFEVLDLMPQIVIDLGYH
jgi:phosphoribosylpyrophosphate synthetase